MSKITTVLFDFDGVVADTESQYDVFWSEIADRYQFGIANFSHVIKGTTLTNIFEKYMSDYPKEEHEKISCACADFEKNMQFVEIPGAISFIRILKKEGIKVGLVTSSDDTKMERAFKALELEGMFDSVVTANRISKGKPDPMCYLLGASDMQAKPEECVVFEDAFSGIQAGTSAGMRVIGLSTTNSEESLKDKVYAVIPNFRDAEGILKRMENGLAACLCGDRD